MRIEDRFTVALPLPETWEVLRDVERIAPCMPGAQLTEIEGDEYRGVVKIKLGAITAQYKGSVHFAEIDEAGHRMVLAAKGRETRGQGNASADVVVTLVATDAGTEVAIETDLTISGKIAQFGRGVLADVSSKLLGEFARCLEDDLARRDGGERPGAGAAAPVDDLAGDEGADPGMALPEPVGDAADSFATSAQQTTGDRTSGYETTSSPATGFETTGEEADARAGHDGPDANGSATEGGTGPRPSPLRTVESRSSEPLDLLALAGPGMAQRALPVALVVDLVLLAVTRRAAVRWLLSAAGTGLVAAVVLGSRPDD